MNAFCWNLKQIVGFVFKTDVVVNSIPGNLELNRGPLSLALLGKAGPDLQKELYTAEQKLPVDVGTILQTSGCNLHCHRVLHVVAPDWKNDSTSSRKVGHSLNSSGMGASLDSFKYNVDWTLSISLL